ncbi:MAG: hypothetical protein KF784_05855 [Fimbriimonadaceae bacterium]|nr:hypothetical protein [Fimbriimonadaceae bacterium]
MKKLLASRKLWFGIAKVSGLLIVATLLIFRGDYRILTGLDIFLKKQPGVTVYLDYFADGDQAGVVDTVWTAKTSRFLYAGCIGDGPIRESCIGPTIIRLKSGRLIVAGGAQVEIVEGKKEQVLTALP